MSDEILTQPYLFDSARSPDVGLDGSAASDSDVLSVSLTENAKKQFVMMTPEEKVEYFDRRARAHEDNQGVGKLLCR